MQICSDMMVTANGGLQVTSQYHWRVYGFSKFDCVYKMMVEGDSAGIDGVQDHRVSSDARVVLHPTIRMFGDRTCRPRTPFNDNRFQAASAFPESVLR